MNTCLMSPVELFLAELKDWITKTPKKGRKGTGNIAVMGLAVMGLILLLIQYLAPSGISWQVGVNDDFADTVSYMGSLTYVASSLALDPEERCAYVESAVDSMREGLADRGIELECLPTLLYLDGEDPDLTVFYTLERGESYVSGYAGCDILPNLPSEPWGEGHGGGGDGGDGGGRGDLTDYLIWFPSVVDEFETHGAVHHVAALLVNTYSEGFDVTLLYEGEDTLLRWLVVPLHSPRAVHGDGECINFWMSGRSHHRSPVEGVALVHMWLVRESQDPGSSGQNKGHGKGHKSDGSDMVYAYDSLFPSLSSDSSSTLTITWSSDKQTHLSQIRKGFTEWCKSDDKGGKGKKG